MRIYQKNNIILFAFLIFLFILQFFQINSELLNNIIRLGDHPYRYTHFSYNSEGDLIIDIEGYPSTKERRFYGIKKNGNGYFSNTDGSPNYKGKLTFQYSDGRVEGESCFIKMQSTSSSYKGTELLFGISKDEYGIFKTEFYDLNSGYTYYYITKELFGYITSNVFTIIPDPLNSDTQYNYYISYISKTSDEKYKLYTKKANFYYNSNTNKGVNQEKMDEIDSVSQTIISCFFTDNYLYICFYTKNDLKLTIWVFDTQTKTDKKNYIHNYREAYDRRFYKGIHLKEEIGFFAYYKNNETIPTFSLYQVKSDKTVEIYKSHSDIYATQGNYYNIDMLNDLIKLNNNTVFFVSTNSDKKGLNIIVFSLYDNDNYINIRYFFINTWEENTIKFYSELRLSLFNNFLLMGFSHCNQEICNEYQYTNYEHFASLIMFNYPNITKSNFDVIEYIYKSNKNIENEININFEDFLIIENNIFGYVYKGIKIINYSDEIYLVIDEDFVNSGMSIDKSENLILKFKSDGTYNQGIFNIEFSFIITEPDYGTNNNYMIYIDDRSGNYLKNEEPYYQRHEYIGRNMDLNITLSKSLTKSCSYDKCSLCYNENKETCITCKYNFDFDEDNNIKTCHDFETEKVEQILSTIPIPKTTEIDSIISSETNKNGIETTKEMTEEKTEEKTNGIVNNSSCKNDEIISGNCNSKIKSNQLKSLYDDIKNRIKANSSEIITTENVIFQISSLSEQKDNDNPNISSIDLGECEKILKNNSGLTEEEDLIVYKIDIKDEDTGFTYVQYEIYNPRNLTLISLDACKDIQITVNVPVILDESTQLTYDSLSKSGYNLFNLNDDFYNDICSTYTTENGTDLTLADRKNIIYNTNGNKTMCQEGCIFQSYNLTTKKSQCDCSVQTRETITNIDEINFEDSSLAEEFFDTLNNSNFRVLKCYKLVFSKKGQKNNIGSYIMSVFGLIFLILFFVFIIKEHSKIKNYIKDILKQKFDYSPKKEDKKDKQNQNLRIFDKNKSKKTELKSKNKKSIENKIKAKNKSLNQKKKNKKRKSSGAFPPRKRPHNSRISENYKLKNSFELSNKQGKTKDDLVSPKKLVLSKNENIKTINIINIKTSNKRKTNGENTNKIKNEKDFLKDYKMADINDEQMNDLEYEIALIIDKRTYFQYYFSLIKKKQLLFFAFCPNNDYNLIAVKMSLLILSFSLYFTINGFFFSDETMNKINQDHGKYDFLYQIPQMFYSTLISAVINIILKILSLSEKQILNIKREKTYLKAKKISNSVIRCLKIKLAFFFSLSLLLMLFFWYFISCFCAVYKNTQTTLIKDTLISFSLSMIYPFGINLFPGFFRIPSLRSKNKKYLYILGGYIALI